ncbi:spore coat protein Y [Sporosarcina newyorkensis 2681]|uniref:Spore coat protein Y n=1 Tax=Sporosarcina newyorkensis 2681 TaxID=1027292 RepID=F9DPW1_9BACL|nr:CotY/CotZ family spore coat protein [Sporosarcina newyorkensis]EGQ27154.1 spore coat protein Y [Sporosarcina newyorkensis 2681]
MGCERTEFERDNGSRCNKSNCICEVVRFIKRVQSTSPEVDCVECDTDCFMAPLGSLTLPARGRVNTRVFSLLTDDGDYFKAVFRGGKRNHRPRPQPRATEDEVSGRRPGPSPAPSTSCVSVFFRVQKVFDSCCATLQVLQPLKDGRPFDITNNGKICVEKICQVNGFEATDTCLTVDLSCFCGIQCIDDVFIDFCDED